MFRNGDFVREFIGFKVGVVSQGKDFKVEALLMPKAPLHFAIHDDIALQRK